jgi:acyl-homoserine lactone acylase PvdQ
MLASLSQTVCAALAEQGQASGTGSRDFTVAFTALLANQPHAPDQAPSPLEERGHGHQNDPPRLPEGASGGPGGS